MKKFLSAILCLCIVLIVCVFPVSAEDNDLDRELTEEEMLYLNNLESKSFEEMIDWAGDDLVRINAVVSKLDEISIPAETSDDYVELDTDGIQAFSDVDPVESWTGTVTHDFGTGIDTYDDDQDLIQDVLRAREENDGVETYSLWEPETSFEDFNEYPSIIDDPTTAKWYNTTCRLFMTVPGYDKFYYGSGFWVGPTHIMTAAHCVFNNDSDESWTENTWAVSVMVVPCYRGDTGRDKDDPLYGLNDDSRSRFPYSATTLLNIGTLGTCTVSSEWLNKSVDDVALCEYDWAILDVYYKKQNTVGWQARRSFSESYQLGKYCMVGYPAVHNCKYDSVDVAVSTNSLHYNWCQWFGNFSPDLTPNLQYLYDEAIPGMSGGPVFELNGHVVGLIVSSVSLDGYKRTCFRAFDDVLLAKILEIAGGEY